MTKCLRWLIVASPLLLTGCFETLHEKISNQQVNIQESLRDIKLDDESIAEINCPLESEHQHDFISYMVDEFGVDRIKPYIKTERAFELMKEKEALLLSEEIAGIEREISENVKDY